MKSHRCLPENPCKNGGECISEFGVTKCKCLTIFNGETCSKVHVHFTNRQPSLSAMRSYNIMLFFISVSIIHHCDIKIG